MKRVFSFTSLVVLFFLSCVPISTTYAQSSLPASEEITLFKTDIELFENTDIRIREEIHYYFPTYRHGIIREIPTDYKIAGGFKRPTTLSLNSISYYPKDLTSSRVSIYERSSKSGYAIFKIGDPETTITGSYVYVIEYTLKNATNYFEDHDELYLNITGNGWNVPIRNAYATIKTPGDITEKICYTGPTGSSLSNCTFEDISNTSTKVIVNTSLEPFEGYTVALKMPKGTLINTTNRQVIAFILSNMGILLPIPVFILLNNIYKRKGKNKKITIIPHYKPAKDIYPLFAGYIYNKFTNPKHITAQIISLAINGHIKIKQEGKRDYLLEKISEESKINESSISTLFKGLFKSKESVNTKKIPSDFYITVRDIGVILSKEVYDEEYFDNARKKTKGIFIAIGVVGIILSFSLFAPLSFLAAVGWIVGLMISSVLALIFGTIVDLRSSKGNEMFYELEGLKMYINTAEKHRIEFHNDPEKFKGVFEDLLPYAIIFGLEKKWAKEFEDIYKEPPSWYDGNVNTFNSYILANSISNISRNVQTKSAAPNSSGGFTSSHGGSGGSGFSGGSSGGGFGGGGGSSW